MTSGPCWPRSLRDVVNAPVVFTYHTKFDIDIARAIKGRALQSAAVKLLVNNITACDEVWVVSRGAGENLRSLGFDGEYIVMPNGVDLPKGRAEEAARGLDRTLDLPRDVPVYLFVGRIMWYKGLRLILDALARLKGAGRDFRMVLVGDGQDRESRAEAYAAALGLGDRCFFVGALRDREAIRAWYTRGDLLLFPSTFDTNGWWSGRRRPAGWAAFWCVTAAPRKGSRTARRGSWWRKRRRAWRRR